MAATIQKDLRTGRAVWAAYRTPRIAAGPLLRDARADVAVIGCGISGAMIAQELAQAGLSVIMLDRRGPLKGSTAASTSLLQYEIDVPLHQLSGMIGVEKAMRAWQRSRLGLESLHDRIRGLGIACDTQTRPTLYLAGNLLDPEGLREEARARAQAGLPVDYLGAKQLEHEYGIRRDAALRTQGSMLANPRKLAAGFLKHALEQGVRIHAPVTVDDVISHTGEVHIKCAHGPVVTAGHAVFATGYEMPEKLKSRKHKIHSTYAMATAPAQKLWPEQALVWEAADPYMYVRTTKDGRVICGGEDEEFADDEKRDALIAQKTKKLEQKLGRLFPHVDTTAQYAWAGSFGGSTTGLPSIGPVPGWPRVLAAMAYGGNGIVFSRIAAEIIRASITGGQDTAADLFRF